MEIRSERPADAVAIRELITSAFRDTAHGSGAEALIVERLRAAGALSVSLVALDQDQIVGHVACSPVSLAPEREGWFGLGPLSVRPDRQRAGFGRVLMGAALQALRRLDAAGCVLLGDPDYYRRFGFVSDAALTYRGRPTRYFQSLRLAGPPARGDVAFHPAFDP